MRGARAHALTITLDAQRVCTMVGWHELLDTTESREQNVPPIAQRNQNHADVPREGGT